MKMQNRKQVSDTAKSIGARSTNCCMDVIALLHEEVTEVGTVLPVRAEYEGSLHRALQATKTQRTTRNAN